jgi:hypothetical protein
MKFISFLFLANLLSSLYLSAQKAPNPEARLKELKLDLFSQPTLSKECSACQKIIQLKPNEVSMDIQRLENTLFFTMSDKEWFDQIFNDKDFAIAVEIVFKNQYECSKPAINIHKYPFTGWISEPVFLKKLKKRAIEIPGMEVVIPITEIPSEYASVQDKEYNLIIINDEQLCYHQRFFNLDRRPLHTISLDLYMDTLPVSPQERRLEMFTKRTLEFTVPFEKNKADFKPEDLKAFQDSLFLTRFNIKKIRIRAFSSIEGDAQNNINLQQKRAASMVSALQAFQKQTIISEIQASENWVDFFNDIGKSAYPRFANLSKEDIKKELEKKDVSAAFEPILKKHRKAILFVDLEKKVNYKDLNEQAILDVFKNSIKNNQIRDAFEIQQAIFQNVEAKKYNAALVEDLEVPTGKPYEKLLVNNLVFKTKQSEPKNLEAIKDFKSLQTIFPDNPFLLYNILVLELRELEAGEAAITRQMVDSDLKELNLKKFDYRLIKRLRINYHIINSLLSYLEKKFGEKDKSVKYIFDTYKNLSFSDEDFVRLAQFFSMFSRMDLAVKLLEERAGQINAEEDLVFYYLNLTMVSEETTKKTAFKNIMNNAYNMNPERYCALFNSIERGGVSFQLLLDPSLKKGYCDNCKGLIPGGKKL